jgi:hypothetical protein
MPQPEFLCELCAIAAWDPVGPGLVACRQCRVVYSKPPDKPRPPATSPDKVQPSPPSFATYGITPKVKRPKGSVHNPRGLGAGTTAVESPAGGRSDH